MKFTWQLKYQTPAEFTELIPRLIKHVDEHTDGWMDE
jgi:hypothetical protein